jgi:signal peptidase II
MSSAPPWLGRRTPSAPVLVAIVPPVVMTVRRAMLRSLRTVPVAGAGHAQMALGDDGGVPDEPTTGSAEPTTETEAAPTSHSAPRRLRLLLSVAAVVLTLDIVTKVLAVRLLPPGQPVSIIGDTVTWTLVRNSGAAFSMATGYTWLLTLIATGVVVGIFWMGRRLVSPWWAIGLGMILGGATGNLVDRFFRSPGPLRGHVVDFLSVGWWPVFNVADPSVVGGAILLVVLSVFGFDFDTVGRRKANEDKAGQDAVSRRKADQH